MSHLCFCCVASCRDREGSLPRAERDVNAKDLDWTIMHHAILYHPRRRDTTKPFWMPVRRFRDPSAVLEGDLTRVKSLIEGGIDVDTRDTVGKSLCILGRKSRAKWKSSIIFAKVPQCYRWRPLRRAAREKGLPEFVQRLIDEGGCECQGRRDGRSPYGRLAAHGGHEEVCRLLIAAGADVNAALDNGLHCLAVRHVRHEGVVIASRQWRRCRPECR